MPPPPMCGSRNRTRNVRLRQSRTETNEPIPGAAQIHSHRRAERFRAMCDVRFGGPFRQTPLPVGRRKSKLLRFRWQCLFLKRAARGATKALLSRRALERESPVGLFADLSVAELDELKFVRCCALRLLNRLSVVEVAVCICTRRADIVAAASKRTR